MEILNTYYSINRKKWRNWLKDNHSTEKEIWLVYYKKHTNKPSITYEDAVEEALCYGWIDSTVKRIDDEKYCQKFTPRNDNSNWSESNKKRVDKLTKTNQMTNFGLDKVNAAKENGCWYKINSMPKIIIFPKEFEIELANNKEAKLYFDTLAPSYRNNYIKWISSAKKEETRIRRCKQAIEMLSKNKKLGMI